MPIERCPDCVAACEAAKKSDILCSRHEEIVRRTLDGMDTSSRRDRQGVRFAQRGRNMDDEDER